MASPSLRIRLLGQLDLSFGDRALSFVESPRVRSLLAYLLLNRTAPQPRQHLAFLLWPDSTEAQARTNLRHVLHDLRAQLPDPDRFVAVTPRTLQWRADARFTLDVAEFEALIARAERASGEQALPLVREAIELYRGDLVAGCYDEWIDAERERLRQQYRRAVERVAAELETRGAYGEAVSYAERLLRSDPVSDDAARRLMRLHAARGDRAAAVRVYAAFAEVLDRELGVGPTPETRRLHDDLRMRDASAAAADPTAPAGGAGAQRVPLIGRTREWACVTGAWRASEAGAARLLVVAGEAGIGKTRLVEELAAWTSSRGAAVAAARAFAIEGALAYAPVVAWLRSEALRTRVLELDRERLSDLARILPELRLQVPELPAPVPLAEADQRHRLFDAVAGALRTVDRPVLLILDDLQWCDSETLRLLHFLLRTAAGTPLLVAATARLEAVRSPHPVHELLAALQSLECVVEVSPDRLTRDGTADLVRAVAGGAAAAGGVDALFRDTQGNPLFVLEALRAGWGRQGGEAVRLTPKVQAVIEARLAQLTPTARALAGLAATVGREFTADTLAGASGAAADSVVGDLDELWRCDIVRELPAGLYDFSHDRVREVAYQQLGPAVRRHQHLGVAQALKRLHVADTREVSGQIAMHYDRAGAVPEAIQWYEAAADAARRLYANQQAAGLLGRALELLRTLPETTERDARELALLTATLAPVSNVEGYGAERLRSAQDRALVLCVGLGVEPPPELLRSIAIGSLSRQDFETARDFGARLRDRSEDPPVRIEADYMLGIAAFWQGRLIDARRHFEAAAASPIARRRDHLARYGLDPQVVCLSRLGNTLAYLGDPAGAQRARDEALALAREVRHPDTHATILVFDALLAIELDETERLRASVEALEAAGMVAPQLTIAADILRAHLRVLDGESEGLARIRSAVAGLVGASHAPGMRAYGLRVLLAAADRTGDVRGRLAAAEQLLDPAMASRIFEAEALRVRAECLARTGAAGAAVEAALARALEVARAQGARLFEERAERYRLRARAAGGRAAV